MTDSTAPGRTVKLGGRKVVPLAEHVENTRAGMAPWLAHRASIQSAAIQLALPRIAAGRTQEQVADELGVPKNTLKHWLRQHRRAQEDT